MKYKYKPKQCACGQTFTPTNGRATRCPPCQTAYRLKKARDGMRRIRASNISRTIRPRRRKERDDNRQPDEYYCDFNSQTTEIKRFLTAPLVIRQLRASSE